jgi:hypothetical protein
MRLVKDWEYNQALARIPETGLVRWCVRMVSFAYVTKALIDEYIINLAVKGKP